VTRIRFDVLDFEEEMADEDRKKAIVPFQLAYAVSIHKAQGLEYRSVKVVIPSSNAEKITHGIFYTAITRAKEKLKIYWSSETAFYGAQRSPFCFRTAAFRSQRPPIF